MKKAIISMWKYVLLLAVADAIGFYFFPDRFHLYTVIPTNLGALIGLFLVNLREEKKKEKNKKLHF
jgi:hypothetical protein